MSMDKNKRNVAAGGVIVLLVLCLLAGIYAWKHKTPDEPAIQGPVYAYADTEHIMMSHPDYAVYHRLELEYNAMVAQYQFEQWHYTQQAGKDGQVLQKAQSMSLMGAAAAEEELKAKAALKEADLNSALQQKYESLLKEKEQRLPSLNDADRLKAVNLQLQLNTLAMTKEQRETARNELIALLRKNGGTDSARAVAEAEAEMAPYKEKAKKELQDYVEAQRAELQSRQDANDNLLKTQLAGLQNTPDPAIWNDEWKSKLDAKKQEMDDEKAKIMDDIRDCAARVAQEQGIDMIFSDYVGIGTAEDVTDDIIAKLA